jgi:hypothetical protein
MPDLDVFHNDSFSFLQADFLKSHLTNLMKGRLHSIVYQMIELLLTELKLTENSQQQKVAQTIKFPPTEFRKFSIWILCWNS